MTSSGDEAKMAAQYRDVIASTGKQPEAAWLADQKERQGLNQPTQAEVERASLESRARAAFTGIFDGDEPDWISAGVGRASLGRGRLRFEYLAEDGSLLLQKIDRDGNPFGKVKLEVPAQALDAIEEELRNRELL